MKTVSSLRRLNGSGPPEKLNVRTAPVGRFQSPAVAADSIHGQVPPQFLIHGAECVYVAQLELTLFVKLPTQPRATDTVIATLP